MTSDEQLERWVAGDSVHNPDTNECCPDFSCCEPALLAAKEVRERFRDANQHDRFEMLGMFLRCAVAHAGAADVYVADGTSRTLH